MSTATPAPIVMKFGGAALADGVGIGRVGAILRARGGERPVAVVSAAQGVTELLLSVAAAAAAGRQELERVRVRHRTLLSQCGLDQELLNRLLSELAAVLAGIRARQAITPAERDFVLSFGERMSARVVAASLRASGHAATPVDAFDLGLLSDSNHGSARPIAGQSAAIRRALADVPGIPVVTGFLAKDAAGNLTTLGRNGSDLSASLLGEAAQAREVQFWKVVVGVMSADPGLVPAAQRLAKLSYALAAEYAFRGANVLHPGALEPLERANIPARVLSVHEQDGAGTLIDRDGSLPRTGAVGVTVRRGVALVHVELDAVDENVARVSELCARIARAQLELLWLVGGAREVEIALVWSDEAALFFSAGSERVRLERGLAVAALVGPSPAQSAAARGALELAGIPLRAQWAASGTGSTLFAIDEAQIAPALRSLHAAVFELPEAADDHRPLFSASTASARAG